MRYAEIQRSWRTSIFNAIIRRPARAMARAPLLPDALGERDRGSRSRGWSESPIRT